MPLRLNASPSKLTAAAGNQLQAVDDQDGRNSVVDGPKAEWQLSGERWVKADLQT